MDTLTMTIKRQWFAAIVAGTKRIEYRELKPYWIVRLAPMRTPFKLRLLNGMTPPIPEAVVEVTRVTKHVREKEYRLLLGRVLRVRRWDRRTQKPRR